MHQLYGHMFLFVVNSQPEVCEVSSISRLRAHILDYLIKEMCIENVGETLETLMLHVTVLIRITPML